MTKQQTTLINEYILNAIDSEGYEVTTSTDAEKLQFLADTFKKEYCFPDNIKRYGSYQNVMEQWLMGLPSSFNIDFENYRIIEISKEWQSIPENATEKQEDRIIEGWFKFIAAKTLQLMAKNKVSVY